MRFVRAFVNWMLVFTSPFWVMPVLISSIIASIIKKDTGTIGIFGTGETWIWE